MSNENEKIEQIKKLTESKKIFLKGFVKGLIEGEKLPPPDPKQAS